MPVLVGLKASVVSVMSTPCTGAVGIGVAKAFAGANGNGNTRSVGSTPLLLGAADGKRVGERMPMTRRHTIVFDKQADT